MELEALRGGLAVDRRANPAAVPDPTPAGTGAVLDRLLRLAARVAEAAIAVLGTTQHSCCEVQSKPRHAAAGTPTWAAMASTTASGASSGRRGKRPSAGNSLSSTAKPRRVAPFLLPSSARSAAPLRHALKSARLVRFRHATGRHWRVAPDPSQHGVASLRRFCDVQGVVRLASESLPWREVGLAYYAATVLVTSRQTRKAASRASRCW